MELNILLILKWLLSGLGLVCFGWLVEDRKTLKSKVDKLEERVNVGSAVFIPDSVLYVSSVNLS